MITDAMVEAGARAICAHTGDDPDGLTYAREMKCTSHDREPTHRWQYWAPFSRAVLTAALSGAALVPREATTAQLAAGQRAWIDDPLKRSSTLYRAMVEASAPIPQDGQP